MVSWKSPKLPDDLTLCMAIYWGFSLTTMFDYRRVHYTHIHIHACMHTSIHSSMRTHVHTHIRTYVHSIPLHWIALHCTALHYITLHLIDFRVPWGSPLEFFSPFHALGIDIFRAEDFTVKCSGSGPRSSAPNGYWNGIRGVPVFLRQAQTNKQGSCCSV